MTDPIRPSPLHGRSLLLGGQGALLAGAFTWGLTALGSATVFLSRNVSRRALDSALGFTAGVMIAASFWSLLAPAIRLAGRMGMLEWFPPLAQQLQRWG